MGDTFALPGGCSGGDLGIVILFTSKEDAAAVFFTSTLAMFVCVLGFGCVFTTC